MTLPKNVKLRPERLIAVFRQIQRLFVLFEENFPFDRRLPNPRFTFNETQVLHPLTEFFYIPIVQRTLRFQSTSHAPPSARKKDSRQPNNGSVKQISEVTGCPLASVQTLSQSVEGGICHGTERI